MKNTIINLTRIRSRWRRKTVSLILSAFVQAGRFYTALRQIRFSHMIILAVVAQAAIFLLAMRHWIGQDLTTASVAAVLTVTVLFASYVFIMYLRLRLHSYHWVQAGKMKLEN